MSTTFIPFEEGNIAKAFFNIELLDEYTIFLKVPKRSRKCRKLLPHLFPKVISRARYVRRPDSRHVRGGEIGIFDNVKERQEDEKPRSLE